MKTKEKIKKVKGQKEIPTSYEKELSRYMWYTWQLVRRNPAYQKDHWTLTEGEMLNKWGFCGSYLEEDQKANEDQEIAQLQDLIKRRTAILGPEHKLIIRLQSDLEERSKAQQDPRPSTPFILPFAWHMRFLDARESIPDNIFPGKAETKREIIIKIDPDYPDELILAGIKDYLRGYRKRIKHREKRIPWNNLDEYLKIYDLKKERKTDLEIARVLYPTQTEDYLSSTGKQNVKNGYRQAKKLIQRGNLI